MVCGNGEYNEDAGEECDDGNNIDGAGDGDGCSSDCLVETGWDCGTSNTVCETICGDALTLNAEECDDGNEYSGDGCFVCAVEEGWLCDGADPTICQTICGDALLKGEEECDDGNSENDDSCSNECKSLTYGS